MTEAGEHLTIYTLLSSTRLALLQLLHIKHGQTTEEAIEACLRPTVDRYANMIQLIV
jgi:hypothetical protein